MVQSERSTGDVVRRGGITKAGNSAARRMLVECAWHYRHPAWVGAQLKHADLPKPIIDIAWKAQSRLCARYRALTTKGKKPTVAVSAIAREIAAFIWAIDREVRPATTNTQAP